MIRIASGPVMRRAREHHGTLAGICRWWLPGVLAVAFAFNVSPTVGKEKAPRKKKGPSTATVSAMKPAPQQPGPAKQAAMTPAKPRRANSPTIVPQPKAGGAQPKWACEETKIQLEPVWKGGSLQCIFKIRNEGEADLTIRARGG